ncbi:MAG: hypothetical protein ABR584_01620 [Candidatus Baltobacteraceae bacterium]
MPEPGVHPFFYLLDADMKIKMASGAGRDPIARFYEADSAPDELPEAVRIVVSDLVNRLEGPPRTSSERLTIEVLPLDGTSGPHIGVFISEADHRG